MFLPARRDAGNRILVFHTGRRNVGRSRRHQGVRQGVLPTDVPGADQEEETVVDEEEFIEAVPELA